MFGLFQKKSRKCTEEDTRFFYLLCLGRDIEHAGELERGKRSTPFGLARQLLSRPIFIHDFLLPVTNSGKAVWRPYEPQQTAILRNGFKRHLKPAKADNITCWQDAIRAALLCPRFLFTLEEAVPGVDVPFLQQQLASPPNGGRLLNGAFESIQSGGFRGYVLAPETPEKPVTLDIFINSSFIGQIEQTQLRRDLQELYGGPGQYGFEGELTVPTHLESSPTLLLRAVNHETGFPAFLSKPFMPSGARQRSMVENLVHQLGALSQKTVAEQTAEIDSILERLKHNFPTLEQAASLSLQDYHIHNEGSPPPQAPESDTVPKVHFIGHTEAVTEAAGLVVRTQSEDQYADHAALCFAQAAHNHPEATIFYADFDFPCPETGKTKPYFRAAFDPELLLADPAYSRCYAVRGEALKGKESLTDQALWLDILEREGEQAFCHVPHTLAHLSSKCTPLCTKSAEAYLAKTEGSKATLQQHSDTFAPALTGYGSVERSPIKPQQKLAVIIPTRDNFDLLCVCVESLLETADDISLLDIIIVDNGSQDQRLLEWLKHEEQAQKLRTIRRDAPFNWAELNNLAAAQTNAYYLLFLNDDTKSVTEKWDTLVKAQLERKEIGIVGARLFYEDGSLQHAGVIINSLEDVRGDAIMHDANGETPDQGGYLNRTRLCHRASAVTGAFLACRKTDFESLSGFDAEHFAVAFNDIDFCLRMRGAGKQVLYDPAISFFHYESKSRGYDNQSTEKKERVRREHEAMIAKWAEIDKTDPFYSPRFLRQGKPFAFLRC